MYVCMYVFMSVWGESMFQKTRSDSVRKPFSIWRLTQFFEICEGGYFWRPQTYILTYIRTVTRIQIAPTSNLKAEGREKRAWQRPRASRRARTTMGQTCYEYRCSSTPPRRGCIRQACMYVRQARMYVCRAGMYVCMYVCQAGMYVCQACMYVWEKDRALETRSESLRKPFSI